MNGEGPVSPDEFVLRRIHKNQVNVATTPPAVLRVAFEPGPQDTDGISLYRVQHVTPETLAQKARSPGNHFIARLAARDIMALGFTLIPTPGDLPGHVSVPELSHAAYQANKQRLKELMVDLASLASRSIVLTPQNP